jgi:hypothetical protein
MSFGPDFPPKKIKAIYGSFSSTQTQGITMGVELPLVYDTKDIASSKELNVLFPSSRIIVSKKGVYKVLASVQIDKTSGGNDDVEMYVSVNTIPVPNSASRMNVNANEESVMTVEWFLEMNPQDFVEVVLYSTVNGIRALSFPTFTPVPAVPSVITTILKIN